MFSLPVLGPSLSFTSVKIITIPTTSFVKDVGSLRAIKAVLVWKERFLYGRCFEKLSLN